MKHILFGKNTINVKVAVLIKGTALNKTKLNRHYLNLSKMPADTFIAFDLFYNNKNKCPAVAAKKYLNDLLYEINELTINILLVCDAPYFKFLTKVKKVEPHYGYVLPCTVEGYEHMSVILCANHSALMYNPNLQEKIERSIETLDSLLLGTYIIPGNDIIHSSYYPETPKAINDALNDLYQYSELTCDIEAKSLEFWNCGISSIAFAWDKHNGIAFGVDRGKGITIPTLRSEVEKQEIRAILKNFFMTYKGKLIWHNCSYDSKCITYQLFMDHLADYKGMIEGITCMTKNFDDTKLIAYMATNNAVKNVLGLKPLSAPFTGNYAEDTVKTDLIFFNDLLIYNLKDTLATWYVKEVYEPIMIKDQQQELYEGLIKESVPILMQTELCGMPINPKNVQKCKTELTAITDKCNIFFLGSAIIKDFHKKELILKAETKTLLAKKSAKTDRITKIYKPTDSVIYEEFNPNSSTQLRRLIYDYLELPVLDLTKGKQPATGEKSLKKLVNHTDNPEIIEIFKQLKKLADASIILSTFIPAFENAQQLPDDSWRLYGNFNLGGTQSMRLSSSHPNLMNLPSGSVFAKIVKECFMPIPGWLFGGSDFAALEDRTGALLTRDPQRLKIYTDGFCGHCLRTQFYWPDKMPDIDPSSVESINSITKKYKKLRQKSKAPSFALQYSGTYMTLMNNCGFSETEAKAIEANYHELYKVSDQWTADLVKKAKKTGYIPLAFGGRIRTPILAKTVGHGRIVPFAAKAEARSGGNAATQSYCILTIRAMNEFMQRVWDSPYKYDILPSATIHDSIYLLFKDNCIITKWVNDNLIECMLWCELPELQHPVVKMGAEFDIYYPHWAKSCTLPNNANKDEIRKIANDHIKNL